MKLLIALALVAFASASCPDCVAACKAATGSDCSLDAVGCAYESTTSCGCTTCDSSVDSYRVGCGLEVCSRRLAETSDLEESTTQAAQWGRRRRRFFDVRRRRRRFFDIRRRRRRYCPPRHCYVAGWNGWNGCSGGCNSYGWRYRYRGITQNPSCGGYGCPNLVESLYCFRCCAQHCAVAGWNGWNGCSAGCSSYGWRWRYRAITRNAYCGGSGCPNLVESGRCYRCCPSHCLVSGWNGWSGCYTNGNQWRYRYRRITRNRNSCGYACPNLVESTISYCVITRHCAVSGWNGWSGWNRSCGGTAYRYRYRRITVNPYAGGRGCPNLGEASTRATPACPTRYPTPDRKSVV